jgi:DNA-3-methyladenine glycosylase II
MVLNKSRKRNSFFLQAIAPFRLELSVWALRRRHENAIDRWDGQTYRRALPLAGSILDLAVTQVGTSLAPRLRVTILGAPLSSNRKVAAAAAVEQLLGLKADLSGFYRLASHDSKLGKLAERFRGLKPPRFTTVFEALVNAVACQQVSLAVGILLLNRLSQSFGRAAENDPEVHAFPQAEDLAAAHPKEIQRLGFSRRKAEYILGLASEAVAGRLDANRLAALPNADAVALLMEQRGIGRWSAEYALLRGLGRWDVFPGDDVGAANKLQRWLRLRKPLDYAGVHRRLARWQPYSGLVYFHLLLRGIAESGRLIAECPAATLLP